MTIPTFRVETMLKLLMSVQMTARITTTAAAPKPMNRASFGAKTVPIAISPAITNRMMAMIHHVFVALAVRLRIGHQRDLAGTLGQLDDPVCQAQDRNLLCPTEIDSLTDRLRRP